MPNWGNYSSYNWFRSWSKYRKFSRTSWDRGAKVIRRKASETNGGVVGNVVKSYKEKDPGIFKLQNTFEAGFEPAAGSGGGAAAPAGLMYIGYITGSTSNGGTHTCTYSNLVPAVSGYSVQEGDRIICVFGRGNSSGYYDTNSPDEDNGNFTFVSGARQGGDDTRDHDHAIFQRTVPAGETSTSFNPDGLGTDSYQACAFHYFVFRNVTNVGDGSGHLRSNYSRYTNSGQGSTTVSAGDFIIFSHACAILGSSYRTSVASSEYEATPGRLHTERNDTDDINMQSWIKEIDADGTWSSPTFTSPSASSTSDATLVKVRVY